MDDAVKRLRPGLVLVVDDEPDICDVLAELLSRTVPGVAVRTVGSGAEALDLLAQENVDLILTDFRMAGMDGLAFLARARRIAPTTPAILMTAFPDVDMAITAVNEQRIARFLAKPFDALEVVRAVEEVMARRDEAAHRARTVARALREKRRTRG